MKKILMAVIALAMCNMLMAQWKMGVSVGYDYNQYDYDTQWAYRLHYGSRGGFASEIPVTYSFNNWFKVAAGIAYVEKGFFLEYWSDSPGNRIEDLERKDFHLTLPISAEFSFGGDRLRGFVSVGGYVSYWMVSYFKGYGLSMGNSVESVREKMVFDPDVDNRVELGMTGGLGVSYQFDEGWMGTVGAKYYYALTDQHKDYQRLRFPSYNRTFVFQVGLMYNIK